MSVTTLPDQLSEPARSFAARAHEPLIDGEHVPANDGRTFETLDPATGRPITTVARAGAADVERAVAAARSALQDGPWSKARAADRARLISRLAELIEANAGELAELEALDNGKPVKLARIIDVTSAAAHFRHFAGWPERIFGELIPVQQPHMLCYTRKEPVGVCGQIIPWNFPLLMAAWKLAPALAAGCTVVLKPAEQTPLSALRLGELVLEAGMPPGVVNILTGDGEAGAALVDHPGVDKIAFTGSTEVGREIGAKASHALKRLTLELGGKSPNIILPDADLKAAIAGSFQAIYFNTGQACNAGSRLFVHRDQFDDVVGALAERAGKTRIGPGLDPASQLGPVVSAEQQERVRSYIEAGRSEGAELVAGGGTDSDNGWLLRPTNAVHRHQRRAADRARGDLRPSPRRDALRIAGGGRGARQRLGVRARRGRVDARREQRTPARRAAEAGSVYVNCWGLSDPGAPFGGYRSSGFGREHGRDGLEAYLETKTVWTNLA